jgi:hypothetical protein
MEIHPPEHPIMTWKQFIVHMTTIVLGLLIAISLEQTVEWFHHLQERDALLADLRAESRDNAEVTRHILDYFSVEIPVSGQWADAVAAAPVKDGYVNLPVPAALRQRDQQALRYLFLRHNDGGNILPVLSVLSTARESQQIQYLPVEDARFFSVLAYADDWANESIRGAAPASLKYDSYVGLNSPYASVPSKDVVTMTTTDRDEAVQSLRLWRANLMNVQRNFAPLYPRLSAISDGVRTERQFRDWQKNHPSKP